MTDWTQAWPAHTRSERAVQLGYLDGYCLALEDFLKASRTLPGMTMTEPEARTRRELRKIASKQLDEARAALKRIKELTYINEDVPSDLQARGRDEDREDQG